MKMVEDFDTAGSARHIARNRIVGHAAVCGRYAAELYGLQILADGIETVKQNYTRFLVLAHPGADLPLHEGKVDKASVVFTLPPTRGALSKGPRYPRILRHRPIKNTVGANRGPLLENDRFYVDLTFDDPSATAAPSTPLCLSFPISNSWANTTAWTNPDQISSI